MIFRSLSFAVVIVLIAGFLSLSAQPTTLLAKDGTHAAQSDGVVIAIQTAHRADGVCTPSCTEPRSDPIGPDPIGDQDPTKPPAKGTAQPGQGEARHDGGRDDAGSHAPGLGAPGHADDAIKSSPPSVTPYVILYPTATQTPISATASAAQGRTDGIGPDSKPTQPTQQATQGSAPVFNVTAAPTEPVKTEAAGPTQSATRQVSAASSTQMATLPATLAPTKSTNAALATQNTTLAATLSPTMAATLPATATQPALTPLRLVLSGRAGQHGWFTSPVVVTAIGATSPVELSLDGGPFVAASSLQVSADGKHSVAARYAQTQAVVAQANVNVDTTPPGFAVQERQVGLVHVKSLVPLPSVSGLANVRIVGGQMIATDFAGNTAQHDLP